MRQASQGKRLSKDLFQKSAEIFTTYLILYLIDIFILNDNAFFGWNPNPLWLPVILFSSLYGTLAGVGAAIISSAYWFFQSRSIIFAGDIFEQTFQRSVQPMLWYATAIALGEVTSSRRRRLDHLTAERHLDKNKMRKLAGYLTQLHEINRTLQIRIATNNRSVAESLAIGSELAMARFDDLPAIIHRMISYSLKTEAFDCFIEWKGETRFPFGQRRSQLSPDDARDLCLVLNHVRDVFTSADPSTRNNLPSGAVAAIPLFHNENVIGAIIIYKIEFRDINADYVAEMHVLMQWCSAIIPLLVARMDLYPRTITS